MKKSKACLLGLFFWIAPAFSEGPVPGTGLQISVAGDIVGTFGSGATNRLDPREAELMLYAPVDHLFDATLSMAAHTEDTGNFFEVHETFIGSSKLIPRSRFRLGQFFLGYGRLNQTHRHDWPFVSAPKVHETFFGDEAVLDTGFEYSYLAPLPFYLDVTLGVTNGWVFGHAHDQGTRPLFPTHYIRTVTYTDLPSKGGMQLALNYVGRRANDATLTQFFGTDIVAKWRRNQVIRFLLQSEVWYRSLKPSGAATEGTLGFYVFPQWGFNSQWYLGLRIDGYTVTTREDSFGNKVGNLEYGIVPTLTFKASEFSTLRAAYNIKEALVSSNAVSGEHSFELQAVFILGSHPAHDF